MTEQAEQQVGGAELAARIAEIDEAIATLESQLNEQKKHRQAVEQDLMEAWAREGTQQVRTNGRTVYVREEWIGSAEDGNTEAMCDALEAAGFGDLVKTSRGVHFRTMGSFVKEHVDEESGEPTFPTEDLQKKIRATKRVSVRSRRSV